MMALNFRYVGHGKAETIQFYRYFIRGFLRWHRTDAVWIKGGRVRRKAYFVFHEKLVERVKRMFKDELRQGGYFEAEHASPIEVLREALNLMRDTHGYLRYHSVELGDPDENWCPMEGYKSVSVYDYCIGKRDRSQKPCPYWNRWRCTYPKPWEKRGS